MLSFEQFENTTTVILIFSVFVFVSVRARDLLDTAGSFCQRSGAETVPILYILTHVVDKINGDIAVAGVRRTDDLVSDVES